MKPNIVIVGLDDVFNKYISNVISEKLEIYFLDVKDIIEYEAINSGAVIKTCGIQYFKQKESKIIKSISTYENTLFNITYDHLTFNNQYLLFKLNSIIVYTRIKNSLLAHNINCEYILNDSGQLVLNMLAYKDRDKKLKSIADVVVDIDLDDESSSINAVVSKIKEVRNEEKDN